MYLFIKSILSKGIADESMIDKILENSLDKFQAAFTSKSYDSEKNYEFFEQLGDLSINKFIISYMGRRFPQLRSSKGVGVLASLRILYGSKEILSKLSEKYTLDKYILCTKEEMIDKNTFRDILEDVFEAFFGALEFSMDNLWFTGMGYIYVYKILETMFDDLDINISYETLVDAKTRLNELKAEYKFSMVYNDLKTPEDGNYISKLYIDKILVGEGYSNIKKTAQIIASEQALIWLETNRNIKKDIPERYKIFSTKTW